MKIVCKDCGYIGGHRTHTAGSIWIEIVLWLCFIIPGVLYSLWRMTKKRKICPKCRSFAVVPADSPLGKKFIAENLQ